MARIRKLYYVKREVIASSLVEAMKSRGVVYEVALADEKMWPDNKKKIGYDETTKEN